MDTLVEGIIGAEPPVDSPGGRVIGAAPRWTPWWRRHRGGAPDGHPDGGVNILNCSVTDVIMPLSPVMQLRQPFQMK